MEQLQDELAQKASEIVVLQLQSKAAALQQPGGPRVATEEAGELRTAKQLVKKAVVKGDVAEANLTSALTELKQVKAASESAVLHAGTCSTPCLRCAAALVFCFSCGPLERSMLLYSYGDGDGAC